ncbi:hypothetical protein AB0K40_33940 [Nonomuraea bangladeshensis]|uniref:DUF2442 domain-containing protein n=1 Tax=Nonomuraea bangladeshensis TaxID=404385 RepID=A0ABV3HDC4_9ACTN
MIRVYQRGDMDLELRVYQFDPEGAVLPDLINERPDAIEVSIDWGDITWPDLEPPPLPQDASVLVDRAEGTADAFGHELPDDEHDELSDKLIEELTDDQHILRFGHNRVL